MTIEEPDNKIDFSTCVRAHQALDWLTPILGGRTIAKAEIADLMRDGSLSVVARRTWDTRRINPIAAWAEVPDEDDEFTELERDTDIGLYVWRRSRQWQLDQMDWRWPSGRFSVVHSLKPCLRILVDDVHFCRGQIKELGESRTAKANRPAEPVPFARDSAPSEPGPDDISEIASKPSSGKGRHARAKAWAAVFTELSKLRDAGKIAEYNGIQKLAFHCSGISNQSGDGGLNQGTLEPLIRALIKSGFLPKLGTK